MSNEKQFQIFNSLIELEEDDFPQKEVIVYLNLKAQGKSKKQIIERLNLRCGYLEQRLRLYILKQMGCKTVNQAVIMACQFGWIDYPNGQVPKN